MEQVGHLHSTRDRIMDDQHKERMDVDMETELSVPSARTPEKTHQQPSTHDGLSSSCRMGRGRFRPRLLATKSFPPYSQCIGGLGEDQDSDIDPTSELTAAPQPDTKKGRDEESQDVDRKADAPPKWSREALKAKVLRFRKKDKHGSSFEIDTECPEKGKWSGKRVKENGEEREHDDKTRERRGIFEGKHWRERSSEMEKGSNGEEEEDGKGSPSVGAQRERGSSMKTTEGQNEEDDGPMEPSTHRHPILSKLLHSSTSSSSSSINFSSVDSDEVFSENEDAASKRKTFKKNRSWKTFLTMVHWSFRRQSSWVQLAGHQGNFQVSKGGEVLKLYSEPEANCLEYLMRDPLRAFVPQYHGLVTKGEHCYIRLEDLLSGLRRPVIMDCKMGVRTFQEEELIKAHTKPDPRHDMYQKMLKIDPSAPSAEEHAQEGVTKWRYLQWRDTTSSTSTLGFRIEGIMMEDGKVQRDFRKIQTLAQVTEALLFFTRSQLHTLNAYHSRLLNLKDALRNSQFFSTHEVIGSSLLFVHDHSKASVWMIDFGKTTPVPDSIELQHSVPWAEGTREDGYLIGLSSLITSLNQAISVVTGQQESSGEEEKYHALSSPKCL